MKYLPFFLICCLALPALAENDGHSHSSVDLMPAKKQEVAIKANAPTLYIGMDKSELVRLERNAGSVIIGNPNHANIIMDNPRLLVVVPRAPGATHFTILDQSGEIILQRHVVVAAPKENYIRVRKAICGEDSKDCVQTESYFCEVEGMCHEMLTSIDKKSSSSSSDTGKDKDQKSTDKELSEAENSEE